MEIIMQNNENCTGCQACIAICPHKCIQMKRDEEGFLYPQKDEYQCVHCNRCLQVCPEKQTIQLHNILKGYIAIAKDIDKIKNSSSGGVFYTIGKKIIESGGIVSGCICKDDKYAHHICTYRVEELNAIQGSKYVQSDLLDCYCEVKKYLESNRMVLFSGTPCQIAGLYMFLGDKPNNLYTIDIICHGVPSPSFFEEHIAELEKTYKRHASSISMRQRDPVSRTTFRLEIADDYGVWYSKSWKEDVYFYLFINGISYRESCYKCKYASGNRIGDITLGDCSSWREYKTFFRKQATSTVLINTEKGEYLWNISSKDIFTLPLDINLEKIYNHQLDHCVSRMNDRNEIYVKLKKSEDAVFREYHMGLSFYDKCREIIKKYIIKLIRFLSTQGVYIKNEK